jgi:hypothetical protein
MLRMHRSRRLIVQPKVHHSTQVHQTFVT